eukprot:CAMPEP_0206280922 /NCGR_PEP_ID=MMETSP0047_2-20121206/38844_1 /ASSEMBLY_ACC=CAM_ASM_000192 /TAXON_ID=195065 /ORGANISM="Chroomonas mesostigmatica_cf, Strain CCMP1168" /LENGTH=104 /DNA_ID=CAMNT_0053711031 /DNA_START=18 /DNA_END=329 /DNA_ORIENTATION=+
MRDVCGIEPVEPFRYLREGSQLSDEDVRGQIQRCGVFVALISDSYFRSTGCKRELLAALEFGVCVIPVILPEYSLWPPAKKESYWWVSQDEAPLLDLLQLHDPV